MKEMIRRMVSHHDTGARGSYHLFRRSDVASGGFRHEPPCAPVFAARVAGQADQPAARRRGAGASPLQPPARAPPLMRRGHVPAALDPAGAAFAGRQQQPHRRRARGFGRQLQPPHRSQRRVSRKIRHHQPHRPGAQRLFGAPQQIGRAAGMHEQKPRRIDQRAHPVGVQPLGRPSGRDPQHRALPLPGHPQRERMPRRPAGLVHAGRPQADAGGRILLRTQ
ncbi:hypothetical protein ACFOHS_07635 [Jhaorihella thermophila]